MRTAKTLSEASSAKINPMRIKGLIFTELGQIVELFPQYSISQHLLHILRKKEDVKEPYSWNDDKLLKKIEQYRNELETELATGGFDDSGDFDDEF